MRDIKASIITSEIRRLCIEANYYLGEDVVKAFDKAIETEESPVGVSILKALKKNSEIARDEELPMCQDTGFTVIFAEIGQEAHVIEGDLTEAINEGVRQGYKDGYLRKSICDPFTRKNTGDNTPATIHYNIVPGDKISFIVAPKGGGSENMSRATMLKPSDGIEGIKDFVLQRVKEAGSNPCPPIIVGIGIGGSIEQAAYIAKKALLRPLGTENEDSELNEIEKELLQSINDLGMGPQGLGGTNYAIGVHVIKIPCHIATLPLSVNICCHASRHKSVTI